MKIEFTLILLALITLRLVAQKNQDTLPDCAIQYAEACPGVEHCIEITVDFSKVDSLLINNKFFIRKNKELRDWLESVDVSKLSGFIIEKGVNQYIALCSEYAQATGIGSDFWTWIIVGKESNITFLFESLSNSPELIYFDEANGQLEFISVSYGDTFFYSRDRNNITYSLERFRLSDSNTVGKVLENEDFYCGTKD